MILGPLVESNFRRALSVSRNDLSIFFESYISCGILLVTVMVVVKGVLDEYKKRKKIKQA